LRKTHFIAKGGNMCKCIKCKRYCNCGEKYCEQCLIDEIRKEDIASKNLKAGGRFYGKEKS
jgi:hypothetical protein